MSASRQIEMYSVDRKRRIAVLRRSDGYFKISVETVLSYENGDEWNPDVIPFPNDGVLAQCSIIDERVLDRLFGTAEDAEAEARRLINAT
jgi:hypothetical protein